MGAARVSILRHKPRSVRARRVSASVIASPRQRARIYQNAPPRGVEDCGAPSGRDPFFWWAASRRPALAAISSRLPPSYLTQLAQAKPKGRASPDDRRFPRRCVERRPLRLVRYPDGGVRAYRACRRPFCPPPPQAPHPSPQDTDGLQLASSGTRDGASVTPVGSAGISSPRAPQPLALRHGGGPRPHGKKDGWNALPGRGRR